MSNFNESLTTTGLGTVHSTKVPDTAIYFVDGKMTIPTITQGSSGPSALVAVVSLNGSPTYTGTAGAEGFHTTVAAAAGDTIAISFSSAAAVDNAKNAIKATITLGVGP